MLQYHHLVYAIGGLALALFIAIGPRSMLRSFTSLENESTSCLFLCTVSLPFFVLVATITPVKEVDSVRPPFSSPAFSRPLRAPPPPASNPRTPNSSTCCRGMGRVSISFSP